MAKRFWTPPAIPARLPGWERAFVDVMERHLAERFAWGVSDCLIVPADLCLGMTGVDPMKGLRRYTTEFGALKVLAKIGCTSVEDALERAFPSIPVLMARRGDCGVLEEVSDGKPWLSTLIVMGDRAIGKGPHGPVSIPTHKLKSAFAIGAR